MTIEEKAKAYDKAVEIINDYYQKIKYSSLSCASNDIEVLEKAFPQIKESEDDIIRKVLIDLVKCNERSGYKLLNNIPTSSMITWLEKQRKPNPYSGTSFEYNGHIWGMCARDNGVEIIFDGELKAFLSSEKSFIYPIHPQKCLAPKSAMEAIKEEKVDNANKIEPKDYSSIDPHFFKTTDKAEPKFKVGDIIIKSQNSDINKFGKFNITGIKDGRYWYNEFIICKISEQNEWETVKVGLKFKVGNWVTDGIFNCKITDVLEDRYIVTTKYEKRSAILFEHESRYHLWTIQDAKDGDVLVADDMIVLFKKRLENDSILTYFHYDTIDNECEPGAHLYYTHIYPATKEQRGQLEKAMANAGYTFDFKKKELKKIEQKPAWSEEDDIKFNKIIDTAEHHCYLTKNDIEWLKSFKEKIN